jgi:hypothetical protein
MKKVIGAKVIIGIGVLVWNQYKKSKQELKNVKIK